MRTRLLRIAGVGVCCALGLAGGFAQEARACGGCFVSVEDDTQVSQHRMILSVSMTETTLWDQIQYTGSAESFAWVLPIKGQVEVGLSSDLLFERLTEWTRVVVIPPPADCPVPDGCMEPVRPRSNVGLGGGGEAEVVVVDQEVVGPYETVQLAASDPEALVAWLESHGYSVPGDIQPVIYEYVESGFGFLALKLVPGESVRAMRPVRITSQGAGLSLPLRMVAAGTGAVTPITLFVVGEGRYEASNFENFEMDGEKLVWDWDEQRSNYAAVKKTEFELRGGRAWLTQWADHVHGTSFRDGLVSDVEADPLASGYEGDPEGGISAADEAEADLDKLVGQLDPEVVWVTRLAAELSREALAADLELGASATQEPVNGFLQAGLYTGEPPCPPLTCPGGDCAVEPLSGGPPAAAWAASGVGAFALALRRRRRRPGRSTRHDGATAGQ